MKTLLALVMLMMGTQALAFDRNLPPDGPQYFSNTVRVYQWVYFKTDMNGCSSCTPYSPAYRCDAYSVNNKLKFHQPGSRDNDYMYVCMETDGRPSYLPPDGPQEFYNTYVGFMWQYYGVDKNGCSSCMPYNPNFRCSDQTVGAKMKAHIPGTFDADYMYTCQPAGRGY